jgi:cytochrome c peroxidase
MRIIIKIILGVVLCFPFSFSINFVEGFVYIPIPPVSYPPDNSWSKEKFELGKKLFFDPILSGDNSMSCATCHLPELGWGDGLPKAIGFEKKILSKNTPTLLNSAFNKFQFWDGRAKSLEEQAKGPIQSPVEMNQDAEQLIKELEGIEEYKNLFQNVFGPSGISFDNIAKSIATFERSLVSGTSDYDRYWLGDKNALSSKAQRGMQLFFGKAKCSICHIGPFFTDNQFHNLGVADVSNKNNMGREAITNEVFHKRAFKTPSLRDLIVTGPYMHDGEIDTLEEVIEFYDIGGGVDENKSPFIHAIGLKKIEKTNLVEFLKSLTSKKYESE